MSRKMDFSILLLILAFFPVALTTSDFDGVVIEEKRGICSTWGICSQKCAVLTEDKFQCSCLPGFNLLSDESTCQPKDPDIKLLFATRSIKVFSKLESKIDTISRKSSNPIGVTFDIRRRLIYWSDIETGNETIFQANLDGSNPQKIIQTGQYNAEGLAYDWIADNIYFTHSDSTVGAVGFPSIGVCERTGKFCTALINLDLEHRPRSIALLPSAGLLFWADWGDSPAIYRSGMDGCCMTPIVSQNLYWPNGLALDLGQPRLYWADAKSDTIESSNLNGEDRRMIRKNGIRHPFSLAVFADTLYWSDWQIQQVLSCNKFTGQNLVTAYFDHREKINGITVLHSAAQPLSQNWCDGVSGSSSSTRCSHICVLAPSNSSRCLCPPGMKLDFSGTICQESSNLAKLFVVEKGTIQRISLAFTPEDKAPMDSSRLTLFPQSDNFTIGTATYDPKTGHFIIFDVNSKQILLVDPASGEIEPLMSDRLNFVTSIAIEPMGEHVFWTDAEKRAVELFSLQTQTRHLVYKSGDDFKPYQIVAVPQEKSVIIALVGKGQGQIFKINVPPTGAPTSFEILANITGGVPISITYHNETREIFWCDPWNRNIEGIKIDGSGRHTVVSYLEAPFSLVAYHNVLYWTKRSSSRLRSISLTTLKRSSADLDLDLHLKHTNSTGQLYLRPVIGLMDPVTTKLTPFEILPESFPLFPKEEEISFQESKTCSLDQYWCSSGECVDLAKTCNQVADCIDGSDESIEECEVSKSCEGSLCEHECKVTPQGPRCACLGGFTLNQEDLKSCQDVDECAGDLKAGCDHFCENLEGSYQCTCDPNYALATDSKTCTPNGNPALVTYVANSQIYVATFDNMTIEKIIYLPRSTTSTGFLDVDVANRRVFWTSENKEIGVTNLETGSSEILVQNLENPSQIIYDWISNNILVVTHENSQIKLCGLQHPPVFCTTLHNSPDEEISSIGISPQDGFVFWTKFYSKAGTAKVARASFDHNNNILDLAPSQAIHPVGLVVDHVFKRVFWIDLATQRLWAVNFDGTMPTTFTTSAGFSESVERLALFDKWILYSDQGQIIRCPINFPNGVVSKNLECVYHDVENDVEIKNLVILQQSVQPRVVGNENPCSQSTCSQICVKTSSNYSCLCVDGYSRSLDGDYGRCLPISRSSSSESESSETDTEKNKDKNNDLERRIWSATDFSVGPSNPELPIDQLTPSMPKHPNIAMTVWFPVIIVLILMVIAAVVFLIVHFMFRKHYVVVPVEYTVGPERPDHYYK